MTLGPDAELVRATRRGDRESFRSLVDRHKGMVLALSQRLLQDNSLADDALQEAVLIAWLNIDRLRNPDRFGAWLAGIAINVCKGWLRKPSANEWSLEAVSGGVLLDVLPSHELGPEERALQASIADVVHRVVRRLPLGQRRAVLLYYIDGLTQPEIAALLGTTAGAVKNRLHHARSTLRDELFELWEEEMEREETGIPMRVLDVQNARPERSLHVAILGDDAEKRYLPIFMGAFEGTALAMQLEGVETPRPMTFAFVADLVSTLDGTLEEVRITRLHAGTFYAVAVIKRSSGRSEVDARPSDALNLALALDAPIRVDPAVLEEIEGDDAHRRLFESIIEGVRSGERGAAKIVSEVQARWPTKAPEE